MKTLVVFVTSDDPSPYLNSVSHCILREGIGRIVFGQIIGAATEVRQDMLSKSGAANRIRRAVQLLLEHLAQGEYSQSGTGPAKISKLSGFYPLERVEEIRAFYQGILDTSISWESREIPYARLRHELAQLARQSSSCIFDVTAIRKAYLADLVALSLNGPITRLTTFNLQRKPEYDRPWDMLLHNLLPNDYSYVDLLDTPVFQERAADVLLRGRLLVTLLGLSTLLFLSGTLLYVRSETLGAGVQGLHIAGAVASIVSFAMGFFSRGARRH